MKYNNSYISVDDFLIAPSIVESSDHRQDEYDYYSWAEFDHVLHYGGLVTLMLF